MNIIVAYLEVQSSHKRRKIAKYGCHKLWGLSVVKQLKEKDNKIFLTLFVFNKENKINKMLKTFYSLSTNSQPIDLTLCDCYISKYAPIMFLAEETN